MRIGYIYLIIYPIADQSIVISAQYSQLNPYQTDISIGISASLQANLIFQ